MSGSERRADPGLPPVVWVTPVAPDYHGGGGHQRQAFLLDALSQVATVHLVSEPVTDQSVRGAVAELVEVDVRADDWSSRSRTHRRLWDLWHAVGSRQPREVAAFAPVRVAMAPILDDLLRRLDPHAVVVEYAGLAPLVALKGASSPARRPRWLLTLHNLGSQMAAHEMAIATGGRRRWLYARDAARARAWERQTTSCFDGVIAVSEVDAAVLDCGATVIPNGVDTTVVPTPLPAAPRVVFTGALYTGPNSDAVRWFAQAVWPAVRRAVPAAELAVVGASPPGPVRALELLPGVEVHADVPEVRPFLDGARVAVVPLRVGSGTRIKALEALAAGRAVVGTTIGLEGLGLAHDREVLVADDPERFAEATVRLLRDDLLATRLAGVGRSLVEARYGWPSIAGQFASLVVGGD